MYRILVPLDGTRRAERAIPWAQVLADPLEAELYLVRVVPVIDPARTPAGEFEETVVNDARAYISAAGEKVSGVPLATAKVLLSQRPPAEELAAYAQEHEIDLAVMAGHGRSGIMRVLAGSVAGEIVHQLALPTLVIGPEALERPAKVPGTILVPLDNSSLARTILAPLAPLASPEGRDARLILFRVLPWPPEMLPLQGAVVPLSPSSANAPDDLVEDLDAFAQELRAKGFTVDERVAFGDRAASIVQVAKELGVDLIAMSTHSLEGLGHWLIRSIAEEVISDSPVPVLTFHPPAAAGKSSSRRARRSDQL